MTTAQDFIALIDKIETNLQQMGVDDAEFDSATGIMGLLDRILDIESGGESLVINTSMSATMSPRRDFVVGETITLSGQLTANSVLDNIGNIVLAGATIKAYHLMNGTEGGPNDYLIGSGTTDNTGSFSLPLKFQKSGRLSLLAKFEGTTHFNSSKVVSASNSYLVNKKSFGFYMINDKWMLEPTSVDFYIGPQYKNAPISLMVGDTKYGPVNVDNSGNVTFDLSDLNPYGVYTSQLMLELNDMYSTPKPKSNTFNISIGADIYLNPDIRVTSTKDILSYADNESATLTAQIVDSSGDNIPIANEKITFDAIRKLYSTSEDVVCTPGTRTKIDENPIQNGSEVEFIVSNVSGAVGVALTGNNNVKEIYWHYGIQDGDTVKLTCENNTVLFYINDIEKDRKQLDYTEDEEFGIFLKLSASDSCTITSYKHIIVVDAEDIYTNNSGNAVYIYESKGVGDVEFTISLGSLLTKTFTIEDCDINHPSEISRYTQSNSDYVTKTLSPFSFDPTNNYRIEYDIASNGGGTAFGITPTSVGTTPKWHIAIGYNSSTTQTSVYWGKETSGESSYRKDRTDYSNWHHWIIEKVNDVYTFYRDGELFYTLSNASYLDTHGNMGFMFYEWESGHTIRVKNIKLKKL